MAYSAVAMPSSLVASRRRSDGSADASPGRASITLVRRARRVVLVGLLMVVLLWSVGTSAPLLPSGRRARTISIGPPRACALGGLSALWRPLAVPALWTRGSPAPWPIRVDGPLQAPARDGRPAREETGDEVDRHRTWRTAAGTPEETEGNSADRHRPPPQRPRAGTFCAAGCVSFRPGAFDAVGDSNPVPQRARRPRPEESVPVRA